MQTLHELLTAARKRLPGEPAREPVADAAIARAAALNLPTAGLSPVALGFWERGERAPSAAQLRCLLDVLDVTEAERRAAMDVLLPEAERRAKLYAEAKREERRARDAEAAS